MYSLGGVPRPTPLRKMFETKKTERKFYRLLPVPNPYALQKMLQTNPLNYFSLKVKKIR